jgi:hypothetical protein
MRTPFWNKKVRLKGEKGKMGLVVFKFKPQPTLFSVGLLLPRMPFSTFSMILSKLPPFNTHSCPIFGVETGEAEAGEEREGKWLAKEGEEGHFHFNNPITHYSF